MPNKLGNPKLTGEGGGVISYFLIKIIIEIRKKIRHIISRVVILTASVRIQKVIPADYIVEGGGMGNLANYLYPRPVSYRSFCMTKFISDISSPWEREYHLGKHENWLSMERKAQKLH